MIRARYISPWLLICLSIGVGACHDGQPSNQILLDKAGPLIWDMLEIHSDFIYKRSNRGMNEERIQELAKSTARKLNRLRNDLAQLHKSYSSTNKPFADELEKFFRRWPNENAFYVSLFTEETTYSENLGAQLFALGNQAHDTRWKWKTPFPIYRP